MCMCDNQAYSLECSEQKVLMFFRVFIQIEITRKIFVEHRPQSALRLEENVLHLQQSLGRDKEENTQAAAP